MKKLLLIIHLLFLALLARAQALPGSGNALTFDGFSRYVDCGAADRGIVGNITIEAWIKTTSSAGQFAVTKYSNSLFSESGFEFGTNQGKAVIYGRAGVGQYLSSGLSTTFVNDGRWHHIVGQVEQNVWRIFVDGVLENSTAYSYSGGDLRTPEAMTIGTYTYLNNFYFQGEIDEVRVWRTARSAADIQANMCRKYATAPTDLVAYYNFDQSSGLAATDKGSQPTTGSLVGFSGTPWHLSGAPLGDASTSLYASTWAAGSKVALATSTTDSAVVSGLPTQTRGVQLYTVNSAPTIAAGTGAAANYIGVFTAGTASTLAYQLRLRPATGPSCRSLQQRSANDQSWANLAPTSTTATSLIANNLTYRGEYILLGNVSAAIAVAGDSAVCAGATGQLTATTTGATSYLWSTGATTPVLSGVGPGTYTVTVGFAGGCTGTGQGTIRLARAPVPTISGDSVVCAGATGRLTASATGSVAYRWNTGATTASITVAQGGTYTVTATSGAGCVRTATYRVRVQIPAPITVAGDSAVCAGTTGRLTATAAGATTYRWNTGATTPVLSGVGPGTYTVTATFASGCSTTAQGTIRQAKAPVPVISGDSVVCLGVAGRLTATATGSVTYRWNTGATTASIAVTQTGTYTVAATSGAGCVQTATYRVRATSAIPLFSLGADSTLCNGDRVVLNGPLGSSRWRYQWSEGSTSRQLSVSTAGTYTLRITNECGSVQATRTITVRDCLKIPNIITPNNDARNDLFVIDGLQGNDWSLDIYNRWGRAELRTDSYHNDWGATAAAGLYYVLLRRPSTGYSYKGWVEVVR